MKKKLTNQERFDILRGYYDSKGFHSMGKEVLEIDSLLRKLGFENLDDFSIWYKSLTLDEIENGKKDWCSGNDCQSILLKLLKLGNVKI